MKIAVVGAGRLGSALAKRLVQAGHDVTMCFARENGWEERANKVGARAAPVTEAAAGADVIALTVPWGAVDAAVAALGGLEGKVVWDCTNALKPDYSGLAVGTTTSAGEIIASRFPHARVVKGIPPFAELLASDDPTINGQPAGSFVCGDDAGAKTVVMELLSALPAAAVDSGPLENARYAEAAGFLLVRLAYGQGLGARVGLALQHQ
ncbi:hypothetical protein GJQ57_12270 [Ralstonia pickettii]|uniref:Pyrroline-5-carboxylate reductase catalytic N-terminal domain-containing protein n=1 Tax=Ralstonia pickettii TaxID=329 RepID=A0A7X2HMT0_RALPI|nr:hypothetical protein [Ralstonia pickettii]